MSKRIRCCVQFCRRTTKPGQFSEWICAPHWKAVPRELKRIRARTRRRIKTMRATEVTRLVDCRSWELCKRAAIEAAGGIR